MDNDKEQKGSIEKKKIQIRMSCVALYLNWNRN